MKTVKEIKETKSDNKTIQYVELARNYAIQSNKIAKDREGFITNKIAEEIVSYLRKAEQADCEYSAYAAAHSAEVWFAKL